MARERQVLAKKTKHVFFSRPSINDDENKTLHSLRKPILFPWDVLLTKCVPSTYLNPFTSPLCGGDVFVPLLTKGGPYAYAPHTRQRHTYTPPPIHFLTFYFFCSKV